MIGLSKITVSPLAVASSMLVISLAINLWQIERHTKLEKKLTETETTLDSARTNLATQERLTQACSTSVANLKKEADRAALEHAAAIAEARAKQKGKETRAVRILSTPPSVPGDTCKSITSLVGDWRKGRVQ